MDGGPSHRRLLDEVDGDEEGYRPHRLGYPSPSAGSEPCVAKIRAPGPSAKLTAPLFGDFGSLHASASASVGPPMSDLDMGGAAGGPAPGRRAILLTGPRRAGKTSIWRVVFNKLPPHETLWLEMTHEVELMEVSHNSLVQFEVWDFPGDKKITDPLPSGYAAAVGAPEGRRYSGVDLLKRAGAVVFVLDAQLGFDEEAVETLRDVLAAMAAHAPGVPLDIFLHKMDGDMYQSSDSRMELEAAVQSQVLGVMRDVGISGVGGAAAGPTRGVTYYLTSVYDHSVFEAFSKVVQRLVRPLGTLETLLDQFVQYSGFTKAFLYDVVSKVYLASDTSPGGDALEELCADSIDVAIDISCIYGSSAGDSLGRGSGEETGEDSFAFDPQSACSIRLVNGTTLWLWSVGEYLALVGVASEEAAHRGPLLELNVQAIRDALRELLAEDVTQAG